MRRAVMVATEDLLVEGGYGDLSPGRVAARAGVGRATVYRRWGSAVELVIDLLDDMADRSLPRARTGDLRRDLRENALLVGRTLADPRQGALFRAMVAAGTADPRAGAALAHFYRRRLEEWAPCVTEAVARGEVPAGTDPHRTLTAVAAPLYYRLLLTGAPVDAAESARAADAAFVAARAGLFVPGPHAADHDADDGAPR